MSPLFKRKLALLVALHGDSSWKGESAAAAMLGDIHWKDTAVKPRISGLQNSGNLQNSGQHLNDQNDLFY